MPNAAEVDAFWRTHGVTLAPPVNLRINMSEVRPYNLLGARQTRSGGNKLVVGKVLPTLAPVEYSFN